MPNSSYKLDLLPNPPLTRWTLRPRIDLHSHLHALWICRRYVRIMRHSSTSLKACTSDQDPERPSLFHNSRPLVRTSLFRRNHSASSSFKLYHSTKRSASAPPLLESFHILPLGPLFVKHTMSAFLAPNRISSAQAHFLVAFATDILYAWAGGGVACLDTVRGGVA